MTEEIWRPAPGAIGYEVSNLGRIRSLLRGAPRVLRPTLNANGYLIIKTNGVTKNVHRLIALAFLGEPQPGQEVRHLNGDAADARVQNLAWGTRSQNMLDRTAHGRDHDANKTHCPQGHPYDEANTLIGTRRGRPARICKTCRVATHRRSYERALLRAAGIKAA